jgi:hypothetical protein
VRRISVVPKSETRDHPILFASSVSFAFHLSF